jgi:type IV pilus assembly protein PilC
MQLYRYRGVDADGRVIKGEQQALNLLELQQQLQAQHVILLQAQEVRTRRRIAANTKLTRQERLDLMVHLQMLLQAGVSVIDTLQDLETSDSQALRRVAGVLLTRINSGETLAAAMASEPDNFDAVTISLVESGEATGQLPLVLDRIVESMRWQMELIAQTKKALSYPAFVAVVVSGVVVFLMVYLVPQLVKFIQSTGQPLPLHTRALIAVSDAFVHYWWLILGTPPAVAMLIAYAARRIEPLRFQLHRLLLELPVLGQVLKKIILARLMDVFGLTYRSGVPLLEGLELCIQVTTNLPIRRAVERARDRILNGTGITDAFAQEPIFPSLVIRMLRVGESTGALDRALENVTYFFNREVRTSVDRLQSMIEPIITLILGFILGWIMMAVLGPIYDILGKIT